MDRLFFACAVAAGFVLLGLVVYSYVRPRPEHRPAITALLGLLGFALVASPNWTSISIRSDGVELSLLREMEARQLRALAEFQSWVATQHRADAAASSASAVGPGTPQGPAIPPDAAQPPDPRTPTSEAPSGRPALPSPEQMERLFDALGRGDLDLRTLSDRELLALNEFVTARSGPARR